MEWTLESQLRATGSRGPVAGDVTLRRSKRDSTPTNDVFWVMRDGRIIGRIDKTPGTTRWVASAMRRKTTPDSVPWVKIGPYPNTGEAMGAIVRVADTDAPTYDG